MKITVSKHHIEFDAAKIANDLVAVAALAFQDDCDIGVAVGLMIAARAASIEKRVDDRILAVEPPEKSPRRAFGIGVDAPGGGSGVR